MGGPVISRTPGGQVGGSKLGLMQILWGWAASG